MHLNLLLTAIYSNRNDNAISCSAVRIEASLIASLGYVTTVDRYIPVGVDDI